MRVQSRPRFHRGAPSASTRRIKAAWELVEAKEDVCSGAVVARRTWKAVGACARVAAAAWKARTKASQDEEVAMAVKQACVEMAPSGVKLAQALASRADLVGDRFALRLGELQDAAPPFPSDVARRIVAEELGKSVEDVFACFEDVPIGSASIAQVHRAVSRENGKVLAVKVQRPNASQDAMADAAMLNGAANLARKLFPKKKRARVVQELAQLVGDALQSELDFRNEAKNAAAFATAHERIPFVRVPRVVQSTRRVLISEWIQGWSPTELLATAGCEEKLEQLVRMGVACQCAQLFDTRLMHAVSFRPNLCNEHARSGRMPNLRMGWKRTHTCGTSPVELRRRFRGDVADNGTRLTSNAPLVFWCLRCPNRATNEIHELSKQDPHPGNLLFTEDGYLAYLDFGLLLDVQKHHSQAMLAALVHVVNENWIELANDLANMDLLQPFTNRTELAQDLKTTIKGKSETLAADIQLGALAAALVQLAIKYKFELPPYYSLLVRSLGMLEGIALSVDKDFKIVSAAYPYIVRRLIFSEDRKDQLLLKELILDDSGNLKSSVVELLQRYLEKDTVAGSSQSRSVATCWLEKERAWGIELVAMEMDALNLVSALDKVPIMYVRQFLTLVVPWKGIRTGSRGGHARKRSFELVRPIVLSCIQKVWQESKWLWVVGGFKIFSMWTRSIASTLGESLFSFIARALTLKKHNTKTLAVA